MKLRNKTLNRRQRRFFTKKFLLLVLTVGFFVGAGGVVWYVAQTNQALYISPLPFTKDVTAAYADTSQQTQKVIVSELQKKKIAYTAIDSIDDTTYSITLKENGQVLIGSDKDISEQIASLQVILIRLTMEGKKFAKLDMRFSKPVIVFE